MTQQDKEEITGVIVITSIIYLMCTFFAWNFNPKYWTVFLRVIGFIIWVGLVINFYSGSSNRNGSVPNKISSGISDLFEDKLNKIKNGH